jgi:hypothetical protein
MTRSSFSFEQFPYWIIALLFSAVIWIPGYPAMVDLPQHAAQVAALRDMIRGEFLWNRYFEVNLATPYFLGYALLLPLSFVLDITIAIKVVLSAFVLLFYFSSKYLSKTLNNESEFSLLCLIGVYGFWWWWGFFTFICAAPFVLLFIAFANRFARGASRGDELKMFLLGSLLLISHGLAFLFAISISAAIHLAGKNRYHLKSYRVYLVLFAMAALLRMTMQIPQTTAGGQAFIFGPSVLWRPLTMVNFVSGGGNAQLSYAFIPQLIALLVLIKYGTVRKELTPWIPFVLCVACMLFLPHEFMSTAYFYERFGLFLFVFLPLGFRRNAYGAVKPGLNFAPILASVAVLGAAAIQAQRQIHFNNNVAGANALIDIAEPSKRALSLVFQVSDENLPVPAYVHFPMWYEVYKQGFVDFNFAYFFPELVRFKPGMVPKVSTAQGWAARDNDIANEISDYDLLFVRGAENDIRKIFSWNAQCAFSLKAKRDSWWLFEKAGCRNPPGHGQSQ